MSAVEVAIGVHLALAFVVIVAALRGPSRARGYLAAGGPVAVLPRVPVGPAPGAPEGRSR